MKSTGFMHRLMKERKRSQDKGEIEQWLLIPSHAGKFVENAVACRLIESRGFAGHPYYSFSKIGLL